MNRLERLMNLIAALLHAELPRSAEQLRTRVGSDAYPTDKIAFRRAFERDKGMLRALGIPLEMAPIPYTDPPEDGYCIDRKQYAAKTQLAPGELAALQLAAGLVRIEGSDSGLAALGAAAHGEASELGRLGYDDANDVLIPAAADKKAVAFSYNGVQRTVEPWVVGYSRGHWYFAGFDRLRGAKRTFRVDRIEGPVSTAGDAVEPVGEVQKSFSFRPWEFPDGPPVTARVAIDAERAGVARRQWRLSDEESEPARDGRLIAKLQVRSSEGLRYSLLEFAEGVEILEPAELRTDMIAWLEALL